MDREPVAQQETQVSPNPEAQERAEAAGVEAPVTPGGQYQEKARDEAQASPGERILELQGQLSDAATRIKELEGTLAEAQGRLQQQGRTLEALKGQLALAVQRYRTALLEPLQEIPPELVQGTTVEEVEAALTRARELVERVRSQLEAQRSQERVPLGAPVRTGVNLSALSPAEKIALGLAHRG